MNDNQTNRARPSPPLDAQTALLIGLRAPDAEDTLNLETRLIDRAGRMGLDYGSLPTFVRLALFHGFLAGVEDERLHSQLRAGLRHSAATAE